MSIAKTMKAWIACGVAAISLIGAAAPAQAQLKINLIDNGGVTGSRAEMGFKIAAKFWESVISNDVEINLGIGYNALDDGVIGSTSSTRYSIPMATALNQLKLNGETPLDAALVLPTLYQSGSNVGTTMIRNAPIANGLGIDPTRVVYDTSLGANNIRVVGTEANLKAIGFVGFAPGNDADIEFSSAFSFDFNPLDGIAAGKMDFIGVAIHEIGHALGFTSGVDTYDVLSGAGPLASTGATINWNNQAVGTLLDLFRYSNDPKNVVPGTGPALDWSIGTASYFSIDGGLTQFNGRSLFSTGAYNGDGRQASHFKDTPGSAGGCDGYNQIGVMDPTFCYGEMGVVTATDLAAFDAIGWNLYFDVLANKTATINTAQFTAALFAVPEPLSWATMLVGFAIAGGAIRRRRSQGVALTA